MGRCYSVDGRKMPYKGALFWPGITCGYYLPTCGYCLPASVAPGWD